MVLLWELVFQVSLVAKASAQVGRENTNMVSALAVMTLELG